MKAARTPDPGTLAGMEAAMFEAWARQEPGTEIKVAPGVFKDMLAARCAGYSRRLEEESLLATPQMRKSGVRVWVTGATALVGLAAYKIYAALSTGHQNIGFLILLTIASVIVLWVVCKPSPLSARGRDYPARLEMDFGTPAPQRDWAAPIDHSTLLLMVAVFGLTVLQGTGYAIVHDLFKEEASKNSHGGGDGGCEDGGGCGGGGCGGCGGCGG